MSDGPKVKIDGAEYELLPVDDVTLGEQMDFEKIAGEGLDGLELMMQANRMKAGLIVAWMAISIHRAKPSEQLDSIVSRLQKLRMTELQEAWSNAAGQNPPSKSGSSNGSDASEQPTENGSSTPSELRPVTTPADSGSLGSDESSDISPPISAA